MRYFIVSYSSSLSTFIAKQSVLSPFIENASRLLSILSKNGYGRDLLSLLLIMLSAPLTYILTFPLSLTITDMRLRSESNSIEFKSSTRFSFPKMLNIISLLSNPLYAYPILLAASTRAISSGEGPFLIRKYHFKEKVLENLEKYMQFLLFVVLLGTIFFL